MGNKFLYQDKLLKFKLGIIFYLLPLLLILVMTNLTGCLKTNNELPVLDKSKSMMDYLRSIKDYSYMVKAIEKSKLDGMLGAYGTFTAFVPTNKAFIDYFAANNIDSTQFFANLTQLTRIVKYHLLNIKYPTSTFVTGSLPTSTIMGDYLSFDLSAGIRKTVINGSVKIDSFDVKINNGVLHVIDKLLLPSSLNLYDWLATQPQYSIIFDAFKQTGNDLILKELSYQKYPLGDSAKSLKTLFLETNEVLARSNFKSFDDLAKVYSNTYTTTKQYTDPNDGINLFVRYHLVKQKMFLSDVKLNELVETGVPETFFFFTNIKNVLQINRRKEKVAGVADSVWLKVNLNLQQSNIITSNGIVNTVDTVFSIYKIPLPTVNSYFTGDDLNLVPANWSDTITSSHPWLRVYFPIAGTLWGGTPDVTGYPPAGYLLPRCAGNEWWIKLYTKPILIGNYDIKLYIFRQSSSITSVAPVYVYFDGVKIGDNFSLNDYTGIGTHVNSRWVKLTNKTFTSRAIHEITIRPCAWGPFVSGATTPRVFLEQVEFVPTAP